MGSDPSKLKKETISVTLDPYLLKWFDELIYQEKDFTSVSGIISIGMTEFRTRYKLEASENSAMDILVKMLQTPEGKRAFEKVTSEVDTKPEASNDCVKDHPRKKSGSSHFEFVE